MNEKETIESERSKNNSFVWAPFEIKSIGESGVIEGYASVFGNIDSYRDVVEQGAFTKTLKEHGGKVPILSNHNYDKQIGWGLEASEEKKGLFVRGKLEIDSIPEARAHYALIKTAQELGTKAGLSFGFNTVKYNIDKNDNTRRLTELKLLEWSPVTFPANPKAFATAAKMWLDNCDKDLDLNVRWFIDELKSRGHSDEEIKRALLGAAPTQDDSGQSTQSLREFSQSFKNLFGRE